MKITGIEVTNHPSLGDFIFSFDDGTGLRTFNLLIGINGCGKTQVMDLLYSFLEQGFTPWNDGMDRKLSVGFSSEALIREVKEEIGIDIKPEDVKFVHTSFRPMMDKTGDRVDYFFEVDTWTGEVTNCEPDKCDDLIWVTADALPENTTPHVRVAIACIEKGQPFSELSVEFLKASGMY